MPNFSACAFLGAAAEAQKNTHSTEHAEERARLRHGGDVVVQRAAGQHDFAHAIQRAAREHEAGHSLVDRVAREQCVVRVAARPARL